MEKDEVRPQAAQANTDGGDLPQDRQKDAFDNLHGSLVEYQQRFFNVGLSGTGFALIVIGWLVTSDESRAVLRSNAPIRRRGVNDIRSCRLYRPQRQNATSNAKVVL